MPYTATSILDQLDAQTRDYTFPMLDNGYVYPITQRLSAYRDAERWVIVIEAIGFSPRGRGHNGVNNCLHVYGNRLTYAPGLRNENILYPTADSPAGPTFDPEYCEYLNPSVDTMRLRDQLVPVIHDPANYDEHDIPLMEPPRILVWEYLRILLPRYETAFYATEAELRARIPDDLPLFLRLEAWHHPDVITGQLPSQTETFPMLAEALVSGEAGRFRPREAANTGWRNWPEGGSL